MASIHFEWTLSMSVGEPTIDKQHQRLLEQVNRVIDTTMLGSPLIDIVAAVDFLSQYIDEHLAYEEAYMEKHVYSDRKQHMKSHQYFRDRYADFKQKLGTIEGKDLMIEMEEFLGSWWVNHITIEDHKYFQELGPAIPT